MWPLILSIAATGFGLFMQSKTNQATKAEGEALTKQTSAQNALSAAKQDADYYAALLAQQQQNEAAKAEEIANEKRTNQLITAVLITVFLGLVGIALFKLKR